MQPPFTPHIPKLGASGIYYNEAGKILLGKRCPNDEALPGLWCSPGGGVNFGETIDAAIIREYGEETGLTVHVRKDFISVQDGLWIPGKHTLLVFKLVEWECGEAQALEGFSEIGYFSWHEIAEMSQETLLTPGTRAALNDLYTGFDLTRIWHSTSHR